MLPPQLEFCRDNKNQNVTISIICRLWHSQQIKQSSITAVVSPSAIIINNLYVRARTFTSVQSITIKVAGKTGKAVNQGTVSRNNINYF